MPMRRPEDACPHFVVEGVSFPAVRNVWAVAVSKGFNGSYQTIRDRLRAGASTWAELAVQTNGIRGKAGGRANAKRIASSKNEMAEIIAELDRRKKEMGLDP